jgi:hypothetical protein
MAKIKLRQDDAIFAIGVTLGNLSEAAERLGVCRQTLYTFAKAHPKVQEAIAHGRAVIVDKAEKALIQCLEERQPWAISLTLRTLGKWRGWIEAKDLTPRGQCQLPQSDGLDVPDDDWAAADARQIRRLLQDRLEDAAEDEPGAAEDDLWERQEALLARQHEQLKAQAAQLAAQAARIQELEAATAMPTADYGDEAEDDAIKAQILDLMAEVRNKLGR